MPGKKKSKASRSAPQTTDSVRRDIEAAPDKQLDVVTKSPDRDPFADPSPEAEEDPEEALDIADQLLATLDARDAAAVSETANLPGATAHKVAHNSSTSVGSSGSGKDSLGKGNRRGHSGSGDLLDGVRSAGHELKHAGGRLLSGLAHPGHGQGHNSGNVQGAPTAPASAPAGLESEPSRRSSMRRSLFGHSPKAKDDRLAAVETAQGTDAGESGTETAGSDGKKKVSRQKARKERKAAEQAAQRAQAEAELRANGGRPDEAEVERRGIEAMCSALGVTMHEINPDGHCLYAAVADQLIHRNKVNGNARVDYRATRRATAEHMRAHPDDFMPFISDSDELMAGIENSEAGTAGGANTLQDKHYRDYCDAVENTGVWGGQPEILALTRAYGTQIHIVQAGQPVVKVGEGEQSGEPLLISYHRRMYGLGEHYNSLRKAKK